MPKPVEDQIGTITGSAFLYFEAWHDYVLIRTDDHHEYLVSRDELVQLLKSMEVRRDD